MEKPGIEPATPGLQGIALIHYTTGEVSLSISPACCVQLVKILITLEPYGIFGSNVTYLFILILCSHPGMQNGDEGLPSIVLSGRGRLVKMLITLELHQILHTTTF